jgi:uroporphyrinogen decarboxylase
MNSRERILAAIRHQEPDGVPVDLGATPSSGISAITYVNVKQHLAVQTGPTRVYDVIQQLAQPEDELLDRYHIDALDIGRAFNTRDEDWYDFELPQGLSVQFPAWFKPVKQPNGAWDVFDWEGKRLTTMLQDATFFDQTCFPFVDGYSENYADLSYWLSKVH